MHRKTAKEILTESFRDLALERSIDKITIKDITDHCGYSQATFYRQFKDKYDLIAWDYTRQLCAIMSRLDKDDYSWKQTLLDGAAFYQAQKAYLTNLLRHTSGHDSFVRYMTEINYEALKQYILKNSGKKSLDEKTGLYIKIYVLGTVNLTCEWIMGAFHVPPETLAEVYEHSLPEPLRDFLLK